MAWFNAWKRMPGYSRLLILVAVLLAASVIGYAAARGYITVKWPGDQPRYFGEGPTLESDTYGVGAWWDGLPSDLRGKVQPVSQTSNIHPGDYIGPQACAECHEKNYEGWSQHPHRWMNALAEEATVKGDFSGRASIQYMGGTATFYRDGDSYRMRLERDETVREYEVLQTIGSRFFQYYVGVMISGPEIFRELHDFREPHVLPFGYWLDERQWVPTVHLDDEVTDEERYDPFSPNIYLGGFAFYSTECNSCHTTFPLGDMLSRRPHLISKHAPRRLHWMTPDYLGEHHPRVWSPNRDPRSIDDQQLFNLAGVTAGFDATEKAVTLGVSCEACHLGAKDHAEERAKYPDFFPRSPHLLYEIRQGKPEMGRTHDNVNWACARCHVGNRPEFAAGMSTWNSIEATDAFKGSCYSELTCVHCHNPHQAIGKKWSNTPLQDDALCIKCHRQYESPAAVAAHTHHTPESDGSRCMNCHMPRLNEGLQDIVRTHMIFSPTNAAMIEANHPNACNLCHTDQPIDWTIEHLRQWYDAAFDEAKITEAYPSRQGATAVGWLNTANEAVRLVAADALLRNGDRWALHELIEALDDPFLINRQFAARGLEKMLNIDLDAVGYRFYMTADERRAPIQRLRTELGIDATALAP